MNARGYCRHADEFSLYYNTAGNGFRVTTSHNNLKRERERDFAVENSLPRGAGRPPTFLCYYYFIFCRLADTCDPHNAGYEVYADIY